MPPTDDPRLDELISVSGKVLAGLVDAHQRVDHPEIATQILRLLNAVATYARQDACRHLQTVVDERPSDEPLRRAIARL